MKNFDFRYSAVDDIWRVIAPTDLVFPKNILMQAAVKVRARWEKELSRMNPITDGTKYEHIKKALKALDDGKIEQVFINKQGKFLCSLRQKEWEKFMANTWRAAAQGVAYAANKHMLDVFNATASTRFIRIYRAWWFNNGTGAVTGVLNQMRCNIITSASAGTAVTPIAHDTSNTALNANTTSGHNRTIGVGSIIRQILNSPDEPTVSTLDWDALGTLVPYAEIWNSGYGDTNIQPITCRASENRGFSIQSITTTVGSGDGEIEFTDAAS